MLCIMAGLAVARDEKKFSDKTAEGAPCGWYCRRSGFGRGVSDVAAGLAVASTARACWAGVGTPIAEVGVVEPAELK